MNMPEYERLAKRESRLEHLIGLMITGELESRFNLDPCQAIRAAQGIAKSLAKVLREWQPGALDKISDWCDEHGWDELDSPAFNAWLKSEGIDRRSLMIGKCNMPEGA